MMSTADKLREEQEQRKRLEGRAGDRPFETSYLVEAGAGAGKSTTMTNRIVNLLTQEPPICEPEQLVAITFTVKATQELQTKLEKELRKLLAAVDREKEPEKGKRLEQLAENVDRIQISTIDSFCRKLLTTMPFSNPLGLSGVLEANEEKLARDFFTRYRRENVQEFRALEKRYALSTDTLETLFLQCSGSGDFVPVCPEAEDPELKKLREERLPKAAKKVREGFEALFKSRPYLKPMLNPELAELLQRPEGDFQAGKEGLAALLTFFRSHRKAVDPDRPESGVFLGDKWSAFYGKNKAFCENVIGIAGPKVMPRDKAKLAVCQNALDGLGTLLEQSPEGKSWLNAALVKTVEKLYAAGTRFSVDSGGQECRELKEFRAAFKDFNSPASMFAVSVNANTPDKEVEAIISPKLEKDDGNQGTQQKTADKGKQKKELVPDPEGFSRLLSNLLYCDTLLLLKPGLEEYRREKRELGTATFSDVLVMARDMLRDSREAREYFRSRYRYFYVDEFQDTDAVQVELLFYLATDSEEDFVPGHWEQCRPRPGSLFLVGDPKQGIYRFRGADVFTYNRVKECFAKQGIGKVEVLSFNFRSTMEICDFSRKAFQPAADGSKTGYPVLEGSRYQAPYADMLAVHNVEVEKTDKQTGEKRKERVLELRGAEPLSKVISYPMCPDDPWGVSGFVKAMVENHVPLANKPGGAEYGDFLVLTPVRGAANAYAAALRARGIPVLLSGRAYFRDTRPIAGAAKLLRWLLDPGDELLLLDVLQSCYGAEYRDVRRLLQRGGAASLGALFRQGKDTDKNSGKLLEPLTAALLEENPRDEALCALCADLQELWTLRGLTLRLPAMAVMERLLLGVGCLWPEAGSRTDRQVDYGRVRQFLSRLREEQNRDFPSLARRALELVQEQVEDDLSLRPEENCVRVMNLHKAKGLEGNVVILAASNKKERDRDPTSYRETAGKKLHLCVTEKANQFGAWRVIGEAPDRGESLKEEKSYLEAEKDRLLYVAVTRAKSMLVVSNYEYWSKVAAAIPPRPPVSAAAMPSDDELRWQTALCALESGEVLDLEKMKALYKQQLAALNGDNAQDGDDGDTAGDGDADTAEQDAPPAIHYTPVDFPGREAALLEEMGKRAESGSYAITPSKLDHTGSSGVLPLLKKDQTNDEDREEGEDKTAQPPGKPADTLDGEEDETPAQEETEEVPDGRHKGAQWGTIVHRVMELAVASRRFSGEDLRALARQAAFETLGDERLSPREREFLCLPEDAEGETVLEPVAQAAARAAAFLSDPDSPLRRLTDAGECCTELQFYLRAEPGEELHRHLTACIRDKAAQDRTLEVNGVIDLAVRRPDGHWTVVDYKTDSLKPGETPEQLAERLVREYAPQILSYVKVLELQDGAKVDMAYLCSIPLGGRFIPIALEDAAPPVPPVPAPAGGVRYAAAGLKTKKRGFDPELNSANGATGFNLFFRGSKLVFLDPKGGRHCDFTNCREYVRYAAAWAKTRSPEADTAVDLTNAGNVVALNRMLTMLLEVLPRADWEALELGWVPASGGGKA